MNVNGIDSMLRACLGYYRKGIVRLGQKRRHVVDAPCSKRAFRHLQMNRRMEYCESIRGSIIAVLEEIQKELLQVASLVPSKNIGRK